MQEAGASAAAKGVAEPPDGMENDDVAPELARPAEEDAISHGEGPGVAGLLTSEAAEELRKRWKHEQDSAPGRRVVGGVAGSTRAAEGCARPSASHHPHETPAIVACQCHHDHCH